MRIVIVLILLLETVCFSSCKPKKQTEPYETEPQGIASLYPDTGTERCTPVAIVWAKQGINNEWITYKCFNTVDEISEIESRIGAPEKSEYDPNFTGDYSLIVYHVPPLKPIRIPFSMDDLTKEIVTARGRNKKLYKLFAEKQEREDYRIQPQFNLPAGIPVDAVWVQQTHKYKCFNSVEELRNIIRYLDEPEIKVTISNFTGTQVLVIFYLPPTDPLLLPFSMDDSTKEMITAKGRSRELYKLFNEAEYQENLQDIILRDRNIHDGKIQLTENDTNRTDKFEQEKQQ